MWTLGVVVALALTGSACGPSETPVARPSTADDLLANRDVALDRYSGPALERLITDFPTLATQLANDPTDHDAWTVREMGACHALGVALFTLAVAVESGDFQMQRLANTAVDDFQSIVFGLRSTSSLQTDGALVASMLSTVVPTLDSFFDSDVDRYNLEVALRDAIGRSPELGQLVADSLAAFLRECDGLGVDVGAIASAD